MKEREKVELNSLKTDACIESVQPWRKLISTRENSFESDSVESSFDRDPDSEREREREHDDLYQLYEERREGNIHVRRNYHLILILSEKTEFSVIFESFC